jgi:ElaA protein
MHWYFLHFNELSAQQLYAIMQARQAVFVVEQNCPYQDADGLDKAAYHLWAANEEGEILAYSRILPTHVPFKDYCSIGRILTTSAARKLGLGKVLVIKSIAYCHQLFVNQPIKIGAQQYLLAFYTNLGFVNTGNAYVEDGIPHVYMTLS